MLPSDVLIISEDAAKHYKLQILEANLYVRKMTVTDHVLSVTESTLLKTPANYPYQEEITKKKHFLQQLGSAAGNRKIFLLVNR